MVKVTVKKVAERSCVRARAWPSGVWKFLSGNPAVNGYLFESGKDKSAKEQKERDGLLISSAVPKI